MSIVALLIRSLSQPRRYIEITLVLLFLAGGMATAVAQAPGLTSPDLWKPEHAPFSFKYDGKASATFLNTWRVSQETAAEANGEIHRYLYKDPVTRLEVIAEVRLYHDFPGVIDWVLRFRNEGSSDTPIIEDILPLHWTMAASTESCTVHHAQGSNAAADDFRPLENRLEDGFSPWGNVHMESVGGDSSNVNTLPFFNLQCGDHGVIGAIGWTGDWKADFNYPHDGETIIMTSGMKKTHLLLHPGEEIRTPRIVLMKWTGGDWQDSQNRWRRLLFAHYTPQDKGKAMLGPVVFGSWGSEPIADKLAYIRWVRDHKIPVDVYAVDAGWYGASFGAEDTGSWWKNRGDWFPSPLYYPNGIKPLGDALKAAGLGFSLWIEPEAAMPGTRIAKEHPDWFFRPIGMLVTNLGNPAARIGMTNMISDFITDYGITWYRQDSNMRPAPFWEQEDTPDRIGMTEIRDIEGLYKMWDDLLARHPSLRIDNCASGGRRLDIEMMSRSFAIWRTDYGFEDTLAEQAQTQALAYWVPQNLGYESYTDSAPWTKSGPYSTPENLYLMRLAYDAGYGVTPGAAGVHNEAWVAWIKQALGEYREVQPYFHGDFYPLLSYSLSDDTWTAWQWDRPEHKDGLAIVLRRPQSPFTAMPLRLRHLDPNAIYEVEVRSTYAKGPIRKMKGSDLARLQIRLPHAPDSTLVFYRQATATN